MTSRDKGFLGGIFGCAVGVTCPALAVPIRADWPPAGFALASGLVLLLWLAALLAWRKRNGPRPMRVMLFLFTVSFLTIALLLLGTRLMDLPSAPGDKMTSAQIWQLFAGYLTGAVIMWNLDRMQARHAGGNEGHAG